MSRGERLRKRMDKGLQRQWAKGLIEHTVVLHLGTFTGYDAALGNEGTETGSTELTIDPRPVLENVSLRDISESGGTILAGDIRAMHITNDSAFDALISNPATIWVITGPVYQGRYRFVEFLERTPLNRSVVLRKVQE